MNGESPIVNKIDRTSKNQTSKYRFMFRNYFKTGWRNLTKNKMHSFINIIGLSIGMAVALLIGLWIYDELSFNKNFDNYDNIAQVMHHDTFNGERATLVWNPYHFADLLRKNYGTSGKSFKGNI